MMLFANRLVVALVLLAAVAVRGGMNMGGTKRDYIDFLSASGALSADQSSYMRQNFLVEAEDEATLTNDEGTEPATADYLRGYLLDQVERDRMDFTTARYVASVFSIDLGFEAKAERQALSDPAEINYSGNGNVELVGRLDPDPVPDGEPMQGKKYNGIWGYATGEREYALQCNSNGLHIIDITNPPNIFRVQFIAMPGGTTWRDVEIFEAPADGNTYAYVAAQNGGKLWVVNLSYLSSSSAPNDVDENPIPAGEGYVDRGFQNDGHTVSVNAGLGLLFLNTAQPNRGCQILDLAADPYDPPLIKQYGGMFDFGGTDLFAYKDCHDSIVKENVDIPGLGTKDVLFSADGNSGRFRIVDLANVRERGRLQVIGETEAVPNSYAHFNVVTEDLKYLIGFDEFNVYDMSVYDISDPTKPVFERFLQYPQDDLANARVHNGQVRGDYLYVAYYEVGFRVFDISGLPDKIVEVGKYETFRDPDGTASSLEAVTGGFNGAWNVYSFLPSGRVLISDMKNGLFVFEIGQAAPSAPTTPSPVTTLPPVAPTVSETNCKDYPDWSDEFGFDCEFYAESECQLADLYEDVNGVNANQACCKCGGGGNAPTPPTPPPASETALAFCFPGSSLIQVKDKGTVPMSELQLGDSVLVEHDRFERVYSFGHLAKAREGDYLKLETTSSTLQISANHLVFVDHEMKSIPAGQVKVGDELVDGLGNAATVKAIEQIKAVGLYAPFTPSGKIVVDGLMVSSFAAVDASLPTVEITGLHFSWHWMAHMFEFPHRLTCHYLSRCDAESYDKDGISNWVSLPHRISLWVLQLRGFWPNILKTVVLLLAVAVFSIFSLAEVVVDNWMIAVVGSFGLYLAMHKRMYAKL